MMKRFDGRVAVITGAAGGLGGALAAELAARGCHLALTDVDEEKLEATSAGLADTGVRITTHRVDVTSRDDMSQLPETVVAEHGGVNLLVNNAGITLQKSFATHSLADWDRIVGINWWGVLHGCHYFLPALRAADEAHIVNLSSMAGFLGFPMQSSYCATKAAVKGLSEALYSELGVEGVGVTSVHPGAIRTDMIQATIDESDDLDFAERSYRLAQRTGVAPEKAAAKILRAVTKGKMRVRIGADALLLDVLKRLMPVALHKPMGGIMNAPAK